MTAIEEQHKANEIVRSNTLQTEGFEHDVRIRDILLSYAGIETLDSLNYSERQPEEKELTQKYQTLIQQKPNVGMTLLIEDAAYQVGLATVMGEQKAKREEENYVRLMAAKGFSVSSTDVIKNIEKEAKNSLKALGYKKFLKE